MAALKKLQEQIKCAVCLDTYTNPKLLQCLHVFCRDCLARLVVRNQQGDSSLTCPTCRKVTPVPANGVTGLQSAFHINHLLEIVEEQEKAKDSGSNPNEETRNDQIEVHSISPRNVTTLCATHTDRGVELYCETCGELICSCCVFRDGKHHAHNYDFIKSSYEKFERELAPLLQPIEKRLMTIKERLARLDERYKEISDQRVNTEANIHNTIRRLQETLEIRKTELISELDLLTQKRMEDLAIQRDLLETIQVQLSSYIDRVQENLRTGSQEKVLKKKLTMVERLKELSEEKPSTTRPSIKANMELCISQDITALCQNYGEIYTGELDPLRSHVSASGKSKSLDTAEVGEKSFVVFHAVDSKGHPCMEYIDGLQCELVSMINGQTVEGKVEKQGLNRYDISYQPIMKGRHQLHIKVKNWHIRGSPFIVKVMYPIEKLSSPMFTIDKTWGGPWGVAINQRGELIVSKNDGHVVSIFNHSGDTAASFGSFGTGKGMFQNPRGVAVDDKGNILVVDHLNHRIQKFTSDGRFSSLVGTLGNGQLQFDHPKHIAFNAFNDKIYVVDSNHRVQVLNDDLTFSSTFGKQGNGKKQFNCPWGIACDSAGKVYVADSKNNCIKVFTAEGDFIRAFGKSGCGKGELNWPAGVAVDSNNIVYVSDGFNHRVSVFNSKGKFLTSFGKEGGGPGEFKCPRGIAVDSSGVVYVCDMENNRIQVF